VADGEDTMQSKWQAHEWPIPGKKCKPSPIIAINANRAVKAQTKPVRAVFNFMPIIISDYQFFRQENIMFPPIIANCGIIHLTVK
jgi:hypothetical protein